MVKSLIRLRDAPSLGRLLARTRSRILPFLEGSHLWLRPTPAFRRLGHQSHSGVAGGGARESRVVPERTPLVQEPRAVPTAADVLGKRALHLRVVGALTLPGVREPWGPRLLAWPSRSSRVPGSPGTPGRVVSGRVLSVSLSGNVPLSGPVRLGQRRDVPALVSSCVSRSALPVFSFV